MTTSPLVDLQVNGFRGVDFSGPDVKEADLAQACREMLDAGTTAFLPTLITCPTEVYARNLPLLAKVIDKEEYTGRLLGIHLEGPFLSPQEEQLYTQLGDMFGKMINEGLTDGSSIKKILTVMIRDIEDVEYGRAGLPTQIWKRRPKFRRVRT